MKTMAGIVDMASEARQPSLGSSGSVAMQTIFPMKEFDLAIYEACAGRLGRRARSRHHDPGMLGCRRLDLGTGGIPPDPKRGSGPKPPSVRITLKWAESHSWSEVVPDFVKGEWGLDTTNWKQPD